MYCLAAAASCSPLVNGTYGTNITGAPLPVFEVQKQRAVTGTTSKMEKVKMLLQFLVSTGIAIVIAILCQSQANNSSVDSSNFIHVPIDQILKLEDVVVLSFNKTFGTTTTMFTSDEAFININNSSNISSVSFRSKFLIVSVTVSVLFLAGIMIYFGKKPQPTVKVKNSKIACIFVSGHTLAYNVDLHATVREMKKKIGERIGTDVINDQFLIFSGKRLLDDKRLIDYNVQMHSTLFLSGRILGGANRARFCAGSRQSTRNNTGEEGRGDNTNRQGGTRQSTIKPKKVYSETSVLYYGLLFAGFDQERQERVKDEKNEERFICSYGVTHKAVTALINDLPQKNFSLRNFFFTYIELSEDL